MGSSNFKSKIKIRSRAFLLGGTLVVLIIVYYILGSFQNAVPKLSYSVLNNAYNYSNKDFSLKVTADRETVSSKVTAGTSSIEAKLLGHTAEKLDSKSTLFKNEEVGTPAIFTLNDGTGFIEYQANKGGLKEFIYLKNSSSPTSYQFELNLQNISDYKKTDAGWSFFDENKKEIFQIPNGYMIDGKGDKSEKVTIDVIEKNGKHFLTVSADKKWLSDPTRLYPVAIDPTVSVVVSGGIVSGDAQFGALQRKIVYSGASGAWYAFYADAGSVYYKKSTNGSTWGSAVDIDSGDTDNYNPTVWMDGNSIYVSWIDDSADAIEVNTINTASSDALGTKCTSSDLGTLGSTYLVTIAVADDDSVYLAYSDTGAGTDYGVYDLTFSGCTFTNISGNQFPDTLSVTPEQFSPGTSHDVDYPATVNAGDLLVLIVQEDDDDALTISDFTEIHTQSNTSGLFAVYARDADGTEGGDTFTIGVAASEAIATQIYRIQAGTWIDSGTLTDDVVADGANFTNATADPPNLSPGWTENTLWIAGVGTTGSVTWDAAPTNYTDFEGTTSCTGGDLCGMATARRELNAASENPGTFNQSSTGGQHYALTIAVRPGTAVVGEGDRPVAVTTGDDLHIISQDGNLSHSLYDGSSWTLKNQTIAANTDTVYSVVGDGSSNVWVLTSNASTTTSYYWYDASSWSTETAPWTGQTNLSTVSLTYFKGLVYGFALHDASEQAYYTYTTGNDTSWASETSLGFSAGDLDNISSMYVNGANDKIGVALRQGSNLEVSIFDPATAANQTTIITRIGANTDAAGTSTLFARMAYIGESADDGADATLFGRLGAETDEQQCSGTTCTNETIFGVVNNIPGVQRGMLSQFGGYGTESTSGVCSTTGPIYIEAGIHNYSGDCTVGDDSTATSIHPANGTTSTGLYLFFTGDLTISDNAKIDVTGYGAMGGNGANTGTNDVGGTKGLGGGPDGSDGQNGSNASDAVVAGGAEGRSSLSGAGGGGGGSTASCGGCPGAGSGGGAGANGGNGANNSTVDGVATSGHKSSRVFASSKSSVLLSFGAGGGGGGAGSTGLQGGGGGAGGGGVIWVRTKSFTNNGTISANGGAGGFRPAGTGSPTAGFGGNGGLATNGGAAGVGSTDARRAGGGGGVGGGVLFIEANSVTIDATGGLYARGANGGNGGSSSGAGSGNGGTGANGFVFVEIVP